MVLALLFAAAVMFAYSIIFKPKPPAGKPAAPKTPPTAATAARTAAPTAVPATAATTAAAPAAPAPAGAPSAVKSGTRAVVRTPLYELTFEDGGLAGVKLKNYPPDNDQLLLSRLEATSPRPFTPLVAAGPGARWEADRTALTLGPRDRGSVTFTLRDGAAVLARSCFTFAGDDYGFGANVVGAAPGAPVTLALGTYQASPKHPSRDEGEISVDAMVDRDKIREKLGSKTEEKRFAGDIPWAALRSRYFILAAVAPGAGAELRVTRTKNQTLVASYGCRAGGDFQLYVGPKDYNRLKRYQLGVERTVDLGWSFIGIIAELMLRLLHLFNGLVHNYGVTIIIFSVLMRLATLYPTAIQFRSSQKMQEIQPVLKQLREKYKDDAQRQNQEMMAIYKKYKINPFSGCLPLAIQMPIFWALFNMLRNAIELKGAPFVWWIKDLSAPDVVFPLPFVIPLVHIETFNILPLIMTAGMVVQSLLTLPGKGAVQSEQQKMMAFMPVIFGFLFYNMPSGLVLYWTVNTLLTIPQQLLIMRPARAKEVKA
jgi:YidC/Oxa1 family membrane protein insertase